MSSYQELLHKQKAACDEWLQLKKQLGVHPNTERALWNACDAAKKAVEKYQAAINRIEPSMSNNPHLTGFGGMRRKRHTKRLHHSKRRRTVRRR